MKNFVASLLLFCLTVVAFAHTPQNHDSVVKQEAKQEIVLPSLDVAFDEAIFLPLDVYALEAQAVDFSFDKTESGFKQAEVKPPTETVLFTTKPRKKWIWCSELRMQGSKNIEKGGRQFDNRVSWSPIVE